MKCMGGRVADMQMLNVLNLTVQKGEFIFEDYVVSVYQEAEVNG